MRRGRRIGAVIVILLMMAVARYRVLSCRALLVLYKLVIYGEG